MPKSALKEELLTILARDLESLERAQSAAREGATHEEAKPENDKDTRALEQSYLARGQAFRIDELRTGLVEVQRMPVRAFVDGAPIALGAVVAIEQDDEQDRERRLLFVAPYGGGATLASGSVQVVTPKSPLGRALLGKREGDDVEVELSGKTRMVVIVEVR